MASSKGRTPNFSEPERILLAELSKEFPDIESKGYDGRSLHKKERAWSQLLSRFNVANPRGQKRELKQILDLQSIPRESNNKEVAAMLVELTREANEEPFVIVHKHGGNDVTCKSRIESQERF